MGLLHICPFVGNAGQTQQFHADSMMPELRLDVTMPDVPVHLFTINVLQLDQTCIDRERLVNGPTTGPATVLSIILIHRARKTVP